MSKDNKTERPKSAFFRSTKVAPYLEKPLEEHPLAQKTLVTRIIPSKKSPREEREAGWNDHTKVRGTTTDMLNSGRTLQYVNQSLVTSPLRPKSAVLQKTRPHNERSEPTVNSDLAQENLRLIQELESLKNKYKNLKAKYTELGQAYQDVASVNNKLQETIKSQNATIKRQGEQIKVQGEQIVLMSRSADKAHSRASTPNKSFRSPTLKESSIISQDQLQLADRLATIPSSNVSLSEAQNLSRRNSVDSLTSSQGSNGSRSK